MPLDEKVDELLSILKRLNDERGRPVDEDALRQVIALVLRNPLPDDRKLSQDQIYAVLSQRTGGAE